MTHPHYSVVPVVKGGEKPSLDLHISVFVLIDCVDGLSTVLEPLSYLNSVIRGHTAGVSKCYYSLRSGGLFTSSVH